MRARHRELTEKYKSFRLRPSALFLSRIIQTFFNKFTKKGKKALARRHLNSALTQFRFSFSAPTMYYALIRIFRALRVQFLLASRRKGRKILDVPVPVRRNKRDVISLQTIYNAISARKERLLSDRIRVTLEQLHHRPEQSTLIRQQTAMLARVYQERVNMEYR